MTKTEALESLGTVELPWYFEVSALRASGFVRDVFRGLPATAITHCRPVGPQAEKL
jgi:hypothetical protein